MKITVYDGSKRSDLPFNGGETILEVLQANGVKSAHAPCGGKGICKKCNIYVRSDDFCGSCLSCLTKATDGMIVEISPEVRLSFADSSSAGVYEPTGSTGYAVACDIGTTTVICYLLRLDTGKRVAAIHGSNAQSIYGSNVLALLTAASEGHAAEITDLIISQINTYIASMCLEAHVSVKDVKLISVAANTIIQHFFAGLNPAKYSIAPFTPVSLFGEMLDARSLGLCFNGAAYICPAVSGFIGGNITAGMLSCDMLNASSPVLMADLGANSEMILGYDGKFVACTADAGAAFKASLLDKGMTASAGAISGVELENGKLKLAILGNAKPAGVCGSGLIDALGIMYRLNVLDEMGKIVLPEEAVPEARDMIGEVDGKRVFYLTENKKIFITQADISKFQLAKAAISAGIRILAEENKVGLNDITKSYLSGGFGAFVRPANAADIGLIPSELLGNAQLMGNTTITGAISAAISEKARDDLATLRDSVRFVDLPTHPSFDDAYIDGMMFE